MVEMPMYYNDLKAFLPQRYPFLLVDRVIDYQPSESIRGIKNIAEQEPLLVQGAGNYYSTGLIVESVGQLAFILFGMTHADKQLGKEILLGSLGGIDLFAPVPLGCQLTLDARIVRSLDNGLILRGAAAVRGKTVLSIESLIAIYQ